MANEKFKKDLAQGEKGERHVALALRRHYNAQKVSKLGQGKGFDFRLIFVDRSELVEVKTDFKSRTTGNLFFEIQCSGKPSGLSATQANKWAILIPHLQIILVFEPKEMLEYLQTSKEVRLIKGGDRNAVNGYVIGIDKIRNRSNVETINTNTRIKND